MVLQIVVDVRFLSAGGYGTYLREILPRLMRLGLTFTLLGDRAEILAVFGSDMPIIPCQASPFSLNEQIQLPLKIPTCDLFWSPNYNISWIKGRPKKTLVTLHDAFPFHPFLPISKRIYAQALLKKAASRACHILTVSHFSHSELTLRAGISSSRITPIPLGVSQEHFHPYIDIPFWEEVKRLYKIPPSFLLFVGSSKPHKNFLAALQTARLMNCPLIGVGMTPFDSSFEAVIFLEKIPIPVLRALYQHAIALLYPSFYEGFGLPPLEAMACGCPVIAADVASLPEVCGSAALFVKPQDIEGMAESVKRVSTNAQLRKHLKESGFKQAAQFDWDKTAEGHLAVIEQVIAS